MLKAIASAIFVLGVANASTSNTQVLYKVKDLLKLYQEDVQYSVELEYVFNSTITNYDSVNKQAMISFSNADYWRSNSDIKEGWSNIAKKSLVSDNLFIVETNGQRRQP